MRAVGLASPLALAAALAVGGSLVLVPSACSRPVDAAPAPGPAASPGPGAPGAAKPPLALGERITSDLVPLSEIARSPARFENQVIATSGKVTAVCQAMGCWMEIEDASGLAHVKMHGHTFFVPKTAAGHTARVQARVVRGSGEECLDSPAPHRELAKIELDATGVELD